MKDYYKILGVDEEATEEEIRARWAELTKQYHPDLGKKDSAEETLKAINEAYQTLKDQSTRLEYDLERLVKRGSLRRAQHHAEKRAHFRKVILFAGISLSCVLLGLAMVRWLFIPASPPSQAIYPIERIPSEEKPSPIPFKKSEVKVPKEEKISRPEMRETSLAQQKTKPEEMSPQASARLETPARIPQPTPPMKEAAITSKVPVSREIPKIEEVPTTGENKVTRLPSGPPEAPVPQKIETPQEPPTARKDAPKVPAEVQAVVSEKKTEPAPPSPTPIRPSEEKELKRSEMPRKEVLPPVASSVQIPTKIAEKTPETILEEKPRDISRATERTPPRESPQVSITKPAPPETSPSLLTLVAGEEEVRQFFSNYINQYDRKNIDGFLSLFSPRAIQNQISGLGEIRKVYSTFFNQSEELRYHLEWMNTRIQADRVEVEGRYRVKQVLKRGGEEKIYTGKVRWVLIKEDGKLKIITLNYQHEKSP